MDMELEVDLGACLYKPARAIREHVAFLADRVFIQEDSLLPYCERTVGRIELAAVEAAVSRLDEGGANMVNDRESLCRDDLNTFQITILGQFRIDQDVRPLIGCLCFN